MSKRTKIEPVHGFKTTDGEFFESDAKAIPHQEKLNFESRAREFANLHGFAGGLDREMLFQLFKENRDIIFEVVSRHEVGVCE